MHKYTLPVAVVLSLHAEACARTVLACTVLHEGGVQ